MPRHLPSLPLLGPCVRTLPAEQQEAFLAGIEFGQLDHRAFAYGDLHGPQVLHDWLAEAWSQAVHADLTTQRKAGLDARPASPTKARRRRT